MDKNQEIYETLKRELLGNQYAAGSTFPSEYLLVNRFQVGRCTVNKAVSRLVQEGWLVRGVHGSGTKVNGQLKHPIRHILFLGDILHNYSARILDGIQQAAAVSHCMVSVAVPAPIQLPQLMETWITAGIEGVITMQYGFLPKEYPLPVIYIDEARSDNTNHPIYSPDACTVATRNDEISAEMIKALLQAGHREIAIYAHQDYRLSQRGFRVHGMLNALKKAGIPHADERLFMGLEYTTYDAFAMLQRLYRKFPDTTAIATVSDDLALQVLLALQNNAFKQKPLVTGFGNVRNITDAYAIPSVEQHPQHIGARACSLLIDIIEKRRPYVPFVEYMDAEIINRSAIHFPT